MKLNKYIDHTLLKADARKEDIISLCSEAISNDFKSVCIHPTWIPCALEQLRGSDVLICSVIGFPLGSNSSETKAFEAKNAIEMGADELDMVLNISALKSGLYEEVEKDIAAVVSASGGKTVKVIFETCLLTDEEIEVATKLSIDAGANFIKTSTGFSSSGASVKAVEIMVMNSKGQVEIKASGGIRDIESAKRYIDLGVTRIGTSSGVALCQGKQSRSDY